MNIFQKISLINKITRAIEKSKIIIDSKKDVAEKARKHIQNIIFELDGLVSILPDFRIPYREIMEKYNERTVKS